MAASNHNREDTLVIHGSFLRKELERKLLQTAAFKTLLSAMAKILVMRVRPGRKTPLLSPHIIIYSIPPGPPGYHVIGPRERVVSENFPVV